MMRTSGARAICGTRPGRSRSSVIACQVSALLWKTGRQQRRFPGAALLEYLAAPVAVVLSFWLLQPSKLSSISESSREYELVQAGKWEPWFFQQNKLPETHLRSFPAEPEVAVLSESDALWGRFEELLQGGRWMDNSTVLRTRRYRNATEFLQPEQSEHAGADAAGPRGGVDNEPHKVQDISVVWFEQKERGSCDIDIVSGEGAVWPRTFALTQEALHAVDVEDTSLVEAGVVDEHEGNRKNYYAVSSDSLLGRHAKFVPMLPTTTGAGLLRSRKSELDESAWTRPDFLTHLYQDSQQLAVSLELYLLACVFLPLYVPVFLLIGERIKERPLQEGLRCVGVYDFAFLLHALLLSSAKAALYAFATAGSVGWYLLLAAEVGGSGHKNGGYTSGVEGVGVPVPHRSTPVLDAASDALLFLRLTLSVFLATWIFAMCVLATAHAWSTFFDKPANATTAASICLLVPFFYYYCRLYFRGRAVVGGDAGQSTSWRGGGAGQLEVEREFEDGLEEGLGAFQFQLPHWLLPAVAPIAPDRYVELLLQKVLNHLGHPAVFTDSQEQDEKMRASATTGSFCVTNLVVALFLCYLCECWEKVLKNFHGFWRRTKSIGRSVVGFFYRAPGIGGGRRRAVVDEGRGGGAVEPDDVTAATGRVVGGQSVTGGREVVDHDEDEPKAAGASDSEVIVQNLRVRYPNGFCPLTFGTNLRMRGEEIFCLLGPNGAGKSTTLKVLTGHLRKEIVTSATTGDCSTGENFSGASGIFGGAENDNANSRVSRIRVCGYENLKAFRESGQLGFCPQENLLWDDLTVKEHLTFFAKLKRDSNGDVPAAPAVAPLGGDRQEPTGIVESRQQLLHLHEDDDGVPPIGGPGTAVAGTSLQPEEDPFAFATTRTLADVEGAASRDHMVKNIVDDSEGMPTSERVVLAVDRPPGGAGPGAAVPVGGPQVVPANHQLDRDRLLQQLHLADKQDSLVADLSGGMKRRLSVGLAFVGDPKFVVLDEPSSGLDPFSRRRLWDFLASAKRGRITCFTTHFLDEAESLADRIAIMAFGGEVMAEGSAARLKRDFDCGYELKVGRFERNAAYYGKVFGVAVSTRGTHSFGGEQSIAEETATSRAGSIFAKAATSMKSKGSSVSLSPGDEPGGYENEDDADLLDGAGAMINAESEDHRPRPRSKRVRVRQEIMDLYLEDFARNGLTNAFEYVFRDGKTFPSANPFAIVHDVRNVVEQAAKWSLVRRNKESASARILAEQELLLVAAEDEHSDSPANRPRPEDAEDPLEGEDDGFDESRSIEEGENSGETDHAPHEVESVASLSTVRRDREGLGPHENSAQRGVSFAASPHRFDREVKTSSESHVLVALTILSAGEQQPDDALEGGRDQNSDAPAASSIKASTLRSPKKRKSKIVVGSLPEPGSAASTSIHCAAEPEAVVPPTSKFHRTTIEILYKLEERGRGLSVQFFSFDNGLMAQVVKRVQLLQSGSEAGRFIRITGGPSLQSCSLEQVFLNLCSPPTGAVGDADAEASGDQPARAPGGEVEPPESSSGAQRGAAEVEVQQPVLSLPGGDGELRRKTAVQRHLLTFKLLRTLVKRRLYLFFRVQKSSLLFQLLLPVLLVLISAGCYFPLQDIIKEGGGRHIKNVADPRSTAQERGEINARTSSSSSWSGDVHAFRFTTENFAWADCTRENAKSSARGMMKALVEGSSLAAAADVSQALSAGVEMREFACPPPHEKAGAAWFSDVLQAESSPEIRISFTLANKTEDEQQRLERGGGAIKTPKSSFRLASGHRRPLQIAPGTVIRCCKGRAAAPGSGFVSVSSFQQLDTDEEPPFHALDIGGLYLWEEYQVAASAASTAAQSQHRRDDRVHTENPELRITTSTKEPHSGGLIVSYRGTAIAEIRDVGEQVDEPPGKAAPRPSPIDDHNPSEEARLLEKISILSGRDAYRDVVAMSSANSNLLFLALLKLDPFLRATFARIEQLLQQPQPRGFDLLLKHPKILSAIFERGKAEMEKAEIDTTTLRLKRHERDAVEQRLFTALARRPLDYLFLAPKLTKPWRLAELILSSDDDSRAAHEVYGSLSKVTTSASNKLNLTSDIDKIAAVVNDDEKLHHSVTNKTTPEDLGIASNTTLEQLWNGLVKNNRVPLQAVSGSASRLGGGLQLAGPTKLGEHPEQKLLQALNTWRKEIGEAQFQSDISSIVLPEIERRMDQADRDYFLERQEYFYREFAEEWRELGTVLLKGLDSASPHEPRSAPPYDSDHLHAQSQQQQQLDLDFGPELAQRRPPKTGSNGRRVEGVEYVVADAAREAAKHAEGEETVPTKNESYLADAKERLLSNLQSRLAVLQREGHDSAENNGAKHSELLHLQLRAALLSSALPPEKRVRNALMLLLRSFLSRQKVAQSAAGTLQSPFSGGVDLFTPAFHLQHALLANVFALVTSETRAAKTSFATENAAPGSLFEDGLKHLMQQRFSDSFDRDFLEHYYLLEDEDGSRLRLIYERLSELGGSSSSKMVQPVGMFFGEVLAEREKPATTSTKKHRRQRDLLRVPAPLSWRSIVGTSTGSTARNKNGERGSGYAAYAAEEVALAYYEQLPKKASSGVASTDPASATSSARVEPCWVIRPDLESTHWLTGCGLAVHRTLLTGRHWLTYPEACLRPKAACAGMEVSVSGDWGLKQRAGTEVGFVFEDKNVLPSEASPGPASAGVSLTTYHRNGEKTLLPVLKSFHDIRRKAVVKDRLAVHLAASNADVLRKFGDRIAFHSGRATAVPAATPTELPLLDFHDSSLQELVERKIDRQRSQREEQQLNRSSPSSRRTSSATLTTQPLGMDKILKSYFLPLLPSTVFLCIFVLFILTLTSLNVAYFAENEKALEWKLHILLSGISLRKYWLGNVIFDVLYFVWIAAMMALGYTAAGIDMFSVSFLDDGSDTPYDYGLLLALFAMLFSVAAVLLTYASSERQRTLGGGGSSPASSAGGPTTSSSSSIDARILQLFLFHFVLGIVLVSVSLSITSFELFSLTHSQNPHKFRIDTVCSYHFPAFRRKRISDYASCVKNGCAWVPESETAASGSAEDWTHGPVVDAFQTSASTSASAPGRCEHTTFTKEKYQFELEHPTIFRIPTKSYKKLVSHFSVLFPSYSFLQGVLKMGIRRGVLFENWVEFATAVLASNGGPEMVKTLRQISGSSSPSSPPARLGAPDGKHAERVSLYDALFEKDENTSSTGASTVDRNVASFALFGRLTSAHQREGNDIVGRRTGPQIAGAVDGGAPALPTIRPMDRVLPSLFTSSLAKCRLGDGRHHSVSCNVMSAFLRSDRDRDEDDPKRHKQDHPYFEITLHSIADTFGLPKTNALQKYRPAIEKLQVALKTIKLQGAATSPATIGTAAAAAAPAEIGIANAAGGALHTRTSSVAPATRMSLQRSAAAPEMLRAAAPLQKKAMQTLQDEEDDEKIKKARLQALKPMLKLLLRKEVLAHLQEAAAKGTRRTNVSPPDVDDAAIEELFHYLIERGELGEVLVGATNPSAEVGRLSFYHRLEAFVRKPLVLKLTKQELLKYFAELSGIEASANLEFVYDQVAEIALRMLTVGDELISLSLAIFFYGYLLIWYCLKNEHGARKVSKGAIFMRCAQTVLSIVLGLISPLIPLARVLWKCGKGLFRCGVVGVCGGCGRRVARWVRIRMGGARTYEQADADAGVGGGARTTGGAGGRNVNVVDNFVQAEPEALSLQMQSVVVGGGISSDRRVLREAEGAQSRQQSQSRMVPLLRPEEHQSSYSLMEDLDPEVAAESRKVEAWVVDERSAAENPPLLVLHNLEKVYYSSGKSGGRTLPQRRPEGRTPGSRRQSRYYDVVLDDNLLDGADHHRDEIKHAVRGLDFFGDTPGSVFGLLGLNGAGKTTTFKMMLGLEAPTRGEVYILPSSSGSGSSDGNDKIPYAQLGYCPQFDSPIFGDLTVLENLKIYRRLKTKNFLNVDAAPRPGSGTAPDDRGLSASSATAKQRMQDLIHQLDLTPFLHTQGQRLSGGNKRKLCVAIALLGKPKLLFLDEPSTGMDAVAKRNLWRTIRKYVVEIDKSLCVLTTHSMEEAEFLCDRLTIQVDGKWQCLGTIADLRGRYGGGTYECVVELTSGRNSRVAVGPTTSDEITHDQVAAGDPAGTDSDSAIKVHRIFDNSIFGEFLEQLKKVVGDHGVRVMHATDAALRLQLQPGNAGELLPALLDFFAVAEKENGLLRISLSQMRLEHVFLTFAEREDRGRAAFLDTRLSTDSSASIV